MKVVIQQYFEMVRLIEVTNVEVFVESVLCSFAAYTRRTRCS